MTLVGRYFERPQIQPRIDSDRSYKEIMENLDLFLKSCQFQPTTLWNVLELQVNTIQGFRNSTKLDLGKSGTQVIKFQTQSQHKAFTVFRSGCCHEISQDNTKLVWNHVHIYLAKKYMQTPLKISVNGNLFKNYQRLTVCGVWPKQFIKILRKIFLK